MSRPVVCAAVVLLGCCPATLSAEPAPAPPADFRDYVGLASTRPVLLRVHVQVGGRPCPAVWEEFAKKLFARLDRDGDGVLSKAEVEGAPNELYLEFQFQGAIGLPIQGPTTLELADVDADKDGKVTLAELADYYRRAGLGPVRSVLMPSTAIPSVEVTAEEVTDALFDRLDTDKDGKLSAKELENAVALLRPLDENEDEMLTPVELANGRANRTVVPPALDLAARVKGTRRESHPLIAVEPGEPAGGVARQVIAHYDRDSDGALNREESGLDADTFAALDANRDGRLDTEEFAGFLRGAAGIELTARVGSVVPAEGVPGYLLRGLSEGVGLAGVQPVRIEVAKGGMRLSAAASRRLDPQTLNVAVGDTNLALYVSGDTQGAVRVRKQFNLRQFRAAAKKGVLERKQAMRVDGINGLFDLADRDGDGQLTEKELQGWLDLLDDGAGSVAVLTAIDWGRSLFELLDADGDGRLSLRELRAAWSRLRPHARDGTGLAKADIPRRVQMTLGLGRRAVPAPRTGQSATTVPLWFRKMDRNNDGDISPREFLGTPEDFARLDLDKDGLISADEARAAEERLKKK
jgi:Ca2+-binding EF-hand superfamily protein